MKVDAMLGVAKRKDTIMTFIITVPDQNANEARLTAWGVPFQMDANGDFQVQFTGTTSDEYGQYYIVDTPQDTNIRILYSPVSQSIATIYKIKQTSTGIRPGDEVERNGDMYTVGEIMPPAMPGEQEQVTLHGFSNWFTAFADECVKVVNLY